MEEIHGYKNGKKAVEGMIHWKALYEKLITITRIEERILDMCKEGYRLAREAAITFGENINGLEEEIK